MKKRSYKLSLPRWALAQRESWYAEFAARGLRVPEELSLVGYDGVEWSEMMVPKLTTIRQFKTELGIRAARRLIAILEEGAPDDHHHEVLQPVLQAGGSVRAPASGKGAVDDVD